MKKQSYEDWKKYICNTDKVSYSMTKKEIAMESEEYTKYINGYYSARFAVKSSSDKVLTKGVWCNIYETESKPKKIIKKIV